MKRLILLSALLLPLSASADTAYLNITSLCNGSSTATNHVNWVVLQGFGFGVTNTVTIGSGGGAGRPSIAPLKVYKGLDACTPFIFFQTVKGASLPSVVLETVNAAGNVTMRITLTTAWFSSINTSFGTSGLQELAGLAADKTCVATFDVNGAKTEHCWDAVNATSSGDRPKQ